MLTCIDFTLVIFQGFNIFKNLFNSVKMSKNYPITLITAIGYLVFQFLQHNSLSICNHFMIFSQPHK